MEAPISLITEVVPRIVMKKQVAMRTHTSPLAPFSQTAAPFPTLIVGILRMPMEVENLMAVGKLKPDMESRRQIGNTMMAGVKIYVNSLAKMKSTDPIARI